MTLCFWVCHKNIDRKVSELIQSNAKLTHGGYLFLKECFAFHFILGAIHVLYRHVKTCDNIEMRLGIKCFFVLTLYPLYVRVPAHFLLQVYDGLSPFRIKPHAFESLLNTNVGDLGS